jgi:hypothetical protein
VANRFWVGGTGTWDGSNTTNWSTTTGGGSGASVPGTSDVAIFDASSGGGTVTVASSIGGTNTIQQITAGAFTGTIDFSVNNPSITFSIAISLSGSGARKFLMGTGTFTMTANSGTIFDLATTTNLDGTSDFSAASYVINSTTTFDRTFNGGGRSYGPTTISANTSRGVIIILGANTFSTLSVAAGTNLELANAATQTITTAPTWAGTSSNPIYIRSNSANNVATIAIGSGTMSLEWCGLYRVTGSGGTARNATNSLDFGRNSGITITAPTVGVVGVIGG